MPWVGVRNNQYLMKIEFQVYKIKKVQRSVVWYGDILNTTDLHTLKCLGWKIQYYMFVTKIKKKSSKMGSKKVENI